MQDWIIHVMEQFGYLGIFMLILVENVFPPIPSEVILAFGGFMTTETTMTAPLVIAVATLGSVFGAILLYKIGNILDQQRLEKLVAKYGHYIGLKIEDVRKAIGWYERYEKKTVFFCRMVPIVRSLISIPAGMARMKFLPFIGLTTLGSLIWNSVLVYTGAALGQAWKTVLTYTDFYSYIVYILLGIVVIGFVVWYIKKKKDSKVEVINKKK